MLADRYNHGRMEGRKRVGEQELNLVVSSVGTEHRGLALILARFPTNRSHGWSRNSRPSFGVSGSSSLGGFDMFSFRDILPQPIHVSLLTLSSGIAVDGHLKFLNRYIATRIEHSVLNASSVHEDGKHAVSVEPVTVHSTATP